MSANGVSRATTREPGADVGSHRSPCRRAVTAAGIALVMLAIVLGLYWPALRLPLMGDDYQWVQHAHRALHRPALLLADLDTFYRPANTWALALDRVLWPRSATGHHLTNLLLHALTAWLLVLVGRRFGLGGWLAVGVGVLWVATPFTSEAAIQVAIRFETLLLAAWLALCLAWPGPDERWTTGRRVAAGLALALAMASKETWVVTPALALALEVGWRRRGWRQAWRLPAALVALACLYVGLYFALFPSDKSYFRWDLAALAKLPHEMAAFWGLERLVPAEFPLTWQGVAALAATLGLAAWAWRRANPAGCLGGALLIAPTLPTLMVPFLPLRYVAIPYAGFLLVVATTVGRVVQALPARWRRLAVPAAAALALAWATIGALALRPELADAAAVGREHERLLGEARAVAAELPVGQPWALVRAEPAEPLRAISEHLQGWPKTFFVRSSDPYGLVDAAALFEWVLAEEGTFVRRLAVGGKPEIAGVVDVWIHVPGRFVRSPSSGAAATDTARAWLDRNAPVQVLRITR